MLDTDATVRSSSHAVTDFSTTEQLDVIIEKMVDVESNQHSDSCFVRSSPFSFPWVHISLGGMLRTECPPRMAQILGGLRSDDLVKS